MKVDVCCGLGWGDEGKGKIVSQLSKNYDFVCRWAGGNNAGHTVFVNSIRYKTHLIPSGIFFGVKSIIGPGCVVNVEAFNEEVSYLKKHGFNINLIKISPLAHVITEKHIEQDKKSYNKKLGTTAKGIAPCYRDKFARKGIRVKDIPEQFVGHIWDEKLHGNVLCEGAQGFWLDIDYGNYPYITSSTTLPYGACSLGFAPQCIHDIYGAIKIYDTRSGVDPDFPPILLEDEELAKIGEIGKEYGTTTGRRRTVNYLNLDKLIKAINMSGTTKLIVSKVDILEKVNIFRFYYENTLYNFKNIDDMKEELTQLIKVNCVRIREIVFSSNPERI